jgi:cytochrome c peroxidase
MLSFAVAVSCFCLLLYLAVSLVIQALHKSAFWGHNAMTTFLLQECKVDVNVQDCYGDSALHDAAKFGHEEVLALLLAGGADRTIRNVNGLTPVDVAKLHTKEGCVRRLTNNKL